MGRLHAALSLALFLFGCGGSQSPDDASKQKDEGITIGDRGDGTRRSMTPGGTDDGDDDGMEVEGLKGHISQYDINKGVQKRAGAIDKCYRGQLAGRKYVGGEIELSYVVKRDGTVKKALISKSNLGDWSIEQCLRNVAMGMKFVKPKGGEAEFSVPLEFESRSKALWWGDDRATTEVSEKIAALEECATKAGAAAPPVTWVTAYVGNRGEVQSVGFAEPSGGLSAEWAACAVEVVKAWPLSDPTGKIAKLSFRFPVES
ncbi:MAG: AgmX/PglI C-terminal domain-containing protein [Deltaproteobacteria bacterium]|nr:AgmX/PglI C-terminal domain-containing protein [Deltaproteobacteria bacterium]